MTPPVRYIEGGELPDIAVEWLDDDGEIIDFTAGWTNTAVVGVGAVGAFLKSTGFVGAATLPNLRITWATADELNLLGVGLWDLLLFAVRQSDSKERTLFVPKALSIGRRLVVPT
jgi:hypothetical protein